MTEPERCRHTLLTPGARVTCNNPRRRATAGEPAERVWRIINHLGLQHRLSAHDDWAIEAIRAAMEEYHQKQVNTPHTRDFIKAVALEVEHQRGRWGADHDAGKEPSDWFWLLGYLSGKALRAAIDGDIEKAKHHTISSAAALLNWHAALSGADMPVLGGPDVE